MNGVNNKKIKEKSRLINWPYFFVCLAIIILLFQGATFLTQPEEIITAIQSSEMFEEFQTLKISAAILQRIITALGFFSLALACWFVFALIRIKEERAFIRLLIPAILCLLIARLDAGILGLLASWLYYRKNKNHKL